MENLTQHTQASGPLPVSQERKINSALAELLGDVYVEAVKQGYSLVSFAKAFLPSEICNRFFEDFSLNCQAPGYILSKFLKSNTLLIQRNKDEDEVEEAYWFGWITGHWFIDKGVTGADIAKDYDVEYICGSYEAYHTQGELYVYNKFEQEARLSKGLRGIM